MMREPHPVSDEEPRHIRIYHEDFGDVLWWTRPITEPPYVGSPLCDNWPGYHQWWTPLPPLPRKLLPKWEQRDVAQGIEAAQADETRSGSAEGESPTRRDAPLSLPPTGEGLPEEMLGALVDALDSPEVRQVQGFHYPPKFVIRDCMRKPGNQVVWEGPDTTDEAFFARQCEIERMRVAVGLAFTRSAAGRAALSQGEER